MEKLDLNGDHRLSREELSNTKPNAFTLDTDGDRRLSRDEYRQHRQRLYNSFDPQFEGSFSQDDWDIQLKTIIFQF